MAATQDEMLETAELLEIAEAEENGDNEASKDYEYNYSDKYEIKSDYQSDDLPIEIVAKEIGDISREITIEGEQNSQYFEFKVKRFQDGVDLMDMTLHISYTRNEVSGEDRPINVQYNNSYIIFGWVIPNALTSKAVTLQFGIWASGTKYDSDYLWKTKAKSYTVQGGLVIAEDTIEPDNNWYEQFSKVIDEKVATVAGYVDDAKTVKNDIEGVLTDVKERQEDVTDKYEEIKDAIVNQDTDKTLTISDKAADAKVVGDNFETVNADVSDLKNDLFSLPTATVIELLSTNGYTIGGTTNLNKNGNTISGTVPQSKYVIFEQNPITFGENSIGKKFKIIIDIFHSSPEIKTFSACSFLDGAVNNWSAIENFTVKSGETKHVETEYVPSTQGNLGFYCYGETADVSITCLIYDITDISENMIPFITFNTLGAVKCIHATISDYATKANIADSLAAKDRAIVCWGDSLTRGYGATYGVSDYPTILAALTGKTVYNMGVDGEDSSAIMARQGGFYAYVESFVIPEDTTPVEITFAKTVNKGSIVTKLGLKGYLSIINPVYINDVEGNISYDSETCYFTRAEAGTSVEITKPTPIIPHNAIDRKDDMQCIFVGTNGGWLTTVDDAETRIEKLISEIDMMIDHNTSGQYIVIGMHYYYSWVLYNGLTVDALETALLRRYGMHYINLREYMVNYGLDDAGLTPTEEDTEAIAKGEVPPSLLHTDKIHGNEKFYEILANLVYEQGKILEYFD